MRKILAFLALVAIFFVFQSGTAFAADDQVVVDSTVHQVQVLSLLVGVFLPIATAFVTKEQWSSSTRGIVLALLSTVTSFLTEAINVGGFTDTFDWWGAILGAVMTFTVAVGTHFGLWRNTALEARAKRTFS